MRLLFLLLFPLLSQASFQATTVGRKWTLGWKVLLAKVWCHVSLGGSTIQPVQLKIFRCLVGVVRFTLNPYHSSQWVQDDLSHEG